MRNCSQGRGKHFGYTIHICCVNLPCEIWLLGTLISTLLLKATRSVSWVPRMDQAVGDCCSYVVSFSLVITAPRLQFRRPRFRLSDRLMFSCPLLVYEYAGTEPWSRLRPPHGTVCPVFNITILSVITTHFRWRHSLNHEARFSSWMDKWLPVISDGLTKFNSPLNNTAWQESSETETTKICNMSRVPRQVAMYE